MRGFGWFLSQIEEIYVPGVVSWHAKQPRDEWESNLKCLRSRILFDPADIERIEWVINEHLEIAQSLIGDFMKNGPPPKEVDFADTQYLNFDKMIDYESTKNQQCYLCEQKAELKMERSPTGLIRLVCKDCL